MKAFAQFFRGAHLKRVPEDTSFIATTWENRFSQVAKQLTSVKRLAEVRIAPRHRSHEPQTYDNCRDQG